MHKEVLTKKGKELFPLLKNFEDFYLAGGTALALQIGHRISVDFDLFSDKEISENLLNKVEDIFSDYEIKPTINNKNELTVFVNDVKVTFLYYPFKVINKKNNLEGLRVLSTPELAVTKAYTIGRRGSYKDYIDIYFCIKDNHITLKDIIQKAQLKYKDKFNDRLFLEQLTYLDDIEDVNIDFIKDKISKEQLISFFEKEIKNLNI